MLLLFLGHGVRASTIWVQRLEHALFFGVGPHNSLVGIVLVGSFGAGTP